MIDSENEIVICDVGRKWEREGRKEGVGGRKYRVEEGKDK